jgi:hypothetical protein
LAGAEAYKSDWSNVGGFQIELLANDLRNRHSVSD